MNIKCTFCSKEINRLINQQIIVSKNSNHNYHYNCYQTFLIEKLNNVINQIKTKSNLELIKIFLIEPEIKLSPFEKKIFMDYYLNQMNKPNNLSKSNQNNMIPLGSLSKKTQENKNNLTETLNEDILDDFINKLKNSKTSKLEESLLSNNENKTDELVDVISSNSISVETTTETDSFETANCDSEIETDIETDSDSFFDSDSDLD